MSSTSPMVHGPAQLGRRLAGGLKQQEAGLAAALIVLCVVIGLINSRFFTTFNLVNSVQAVSIIGILAIGMAFVIIAGELDLSVGSVMAVTSIAGAWLMESGLAPVPGVLATLLFGCLIGLVNGGVVVYGQVSSFIVTLGMLSIARGLTLLIGGGLSITTPSSLSFIGQDKLFGQLPLSVLLLVALAIVGQLVLSFTVFGRRVQAVGDNKEAARLAGIPVDRTKIAVFVIAGLCAALAGVVRSSQLGLAETNAGTGIELDVIAAVVIGGASLSGGRGSIVGALLGACLLGVLRNAFVLLRLSPFLQTVSIGLVIVLASLFDRAREGAYRLDWLARRRPRRSAQRPPEAAG